MYVCIYVYIYIYMYVGTRSIETKCTQTLDAEHTARHVMLHHTPEYLGIMCLAWAQPARGPTIMFLPCPDSGGPCTFPVYI